MNDKNMMTPEERALAEMLEAAAREVTPKPSFKIELEKKLMNTHQPKTGLNLFSIKKFASALSWTVGLAAMAFIFVWAIRMFAPRTQPGAENTTFPNSTCPVTKPNGSLPPGETISSPNYLGNGQLWTSLWPDGKIYMLPENQEADGTFSMKWPWWRGDKGGILTIEGYRLDGEANPLRADIPDGYGDTGFQVSALIFPTTGCWEVTGKVGDTSLTFVTEVVFGVATPTPGPVDASIPTISSPNAATYNWNGTTLYLNGAFPQTPSEEMKVYLSSEYANATVEDVKAISAQFGMNAEIYELPTYVEGTTTYMAVDGIKQLMVFSNQHYTYTPDSTETIYSGRHPNAEALIEEFMQKNGFNFDHTIEYSEMFNGYAAVPLTPGGYPIRLPYFGTSGLLFHFNKDGITSVDANLMTYTETATVKVINAEEAFQRLLAPASSHGNISATHSTHADGTTWVREYPLDTPIPYFGWLTSTGRSISGGAPLITLNGYPVTGNTQGIAENTQNVFVQTSGQFHEKNGIKTFEIETWSVRDTGDEGYGGTIQREGDQVVIQTTEGLTIPLSDPPSDLTLPAENVYVVGVTNNGVFDWRTIDNTIRSGGGGGGGGPSFFKLNLTGTPVPMQTATPAGGNSSDPNFEKRAIENQRGMLSIYRYKKADGSERMEYGFVTNDPNNPYMLLEGDNLQTLNTNQNRPLDVWGTVDHLNEYGIPVIRVTKYEIPFPDLQFQVLRGTEQSIDIDGKAALLFTTEGGKAFVQLAPNCYDIIGAESVVGTGQIDESMLIEALIIPDLTYGGYPALCTFSTALATDPSVELTVTADQLYVIEDSVPSDGSSPNTMTIEKIELAYYTPDMRYHLTDPAMEPPYLQPVWRFVGHYSNGDEFEFILQAVTDDFLLPERQTMDGPA